MTSHEQQRAAGRRAGEARWAALNAPHSVIAPHQYQFPPRLRFLPQSRGYCRGFDAPRLFYSRTAGGCRDSKQRRRLGAVPPGSRAAALNLSGAIRSGSRTHVSHLQQHVTRQSTNALEGHRLSQKVGFDTDQLTERHLEPCSPNRGKSFPE